MSNLLTDVKVIQTKGRVDDEGNITDGTIIDMKGYESCLFLLVLGNTVDTAKLNMTVQDGPADDDLSNTVATTGDVTVTADTDEEILALEVVKPRLRYLRCNVVSDTANAEKNTLLAILSGPRDRPTDHDDAVIAEKVFLSPAKA